ncbi:MAG: hypothetical protein AAF533_13130 [Acidobacteriota bacterium]
MKTNRVVSALMLVLVAGAAEAEMRRHASTDGNSVFVGKRPGQEKGRWLEVFDEKALVAHQTACIGDIDVRVSGKRNEVSRANDEGILADKLRELIVERLEAAVLFSRVDAKPPDLLGATAVRIDCQLIVDAKGSGSRSMLKIALRNVHDNELLAHYHGHGSGSGLASLFARAGNRKRAKDDLQENTAMFVQLLREFR